MKVRERIENELKALLTEKQELEAAIRRSQDELTALDTPVTDPRLGKGWI